MMSAIKKTMSLFDRAKKARLDDEWCLIKVNSNLEKILIDFVFFQNLMKLQRKNVEDQEKRPYTLTCWEICNVLYFIF